MTVQWLSATWSTKCSRHTSAC